MGERSRALDALVIAMGDNTEVDENDCAPELRAWVQHWWRKLEPPLIQEEAVIQQVGCTVEDSLESVDSGGGARLGENRAKEASGKEDCVDTEGKEVDTLLAEEREIEEEKVDLDRHARDRQLQEYEDGLRELEEADRQRWEAYEAAKEAERAQCWDDWAMATEIGASSSGSTPRLRVIVQAHNSSGRNRSTS